MVVGDAGQTIFSPSIRPRTRLIVAEVIPRIPRLAVVLAHGAPLALRKIWSPFPPWHVLGTGFLQTTIFSIHLCSFPLIWAGRCIPSRLVLRCCEMATMQHLLSHFETHF